MECLENECGVAHFRQRYRDTRHLAALDQRIPTRIEDRATWRRECGGEEVLSLRARSPRFPFDDLNIRRARDEREREEQHEPVNDRDPLRGFHPVGFSAV